LRNVAVKSSKVRRPSSRSAGFSLIELMLGLAIFTTSFLLILGVFPTSGRAVHWGRTLLLATHIGQRQMEAMTSLPFAQISTPAPGTQSMVSMVNGTTEVLMFDYQVVVTDVSATLKDIRCQVSWSDQGFLHYVNLETMVADITFGNLP